jgi:hypothetical protein
MITEEFLLRAQLQTAYLLFVMEGVLLIEAFQKQYSIQNYFTYLDKIGE